MAPDGGGSPHDLVVETWTMYSIAMTIFLIRVYARYTRFGFKWKVEDFLMVLAVAWYTTFVVTNIAIIEGGGSSLYLPDQFETFTPQDILDRIKGSKIEFASEMCMLNTMYTLKACMILIYFQVTSNLKQHNWVKACAAYTFCGWLATVLVLFFNCHPFTGYFTIPPPQEECASYFRYEVTQCVFNVSSDLAMLSVILPMMFRLRMPLKTKIPVVFIFSMGLVVVICACTSKYFTFRDIWDDSYQFWYLREASIAMYVTNLPYVWGLARRTFSILNYEEANTGTYRLEASQGVYPRLPKSPPAGLFDLETLTTERMGTESEENIIEIKPELSVGASDHGRINSTDYARYQDGSEEMAWAKSEGRLTESREEIMGNFITKTTDVVVREEKK